MPISLLAPLAAACIAPSQSHLWVDKPGAELACKTAMERSETTLGVTTYESIRGSIGEGFDFPGEVFMCMGNHRLNVLTARFDQRENRFEFSGNVAYSGDSVQVRAKDALLDLNRDLLRFGSAEYAVRDSLVRGSAAEILLDGEQDQLSWKTSSTQAACPAATIGNFAPGPFGWSRKAVSAGPAESASGSWTYRFCICRPYPFRRLASASRVSWCRRSAVPAAAALELEAPWYWNIAPNMDATLTPRYHVASGLFTEASITALLRASRRAE